MNIALKEIELEAWESFEVGSYSEVQEFYQKDFANPTLNHLVILSLLEEGNREIPEFLEKSSPFYFIAKAYLQKSNLELGKASESLKNYFKNEKAFICQVFLELAVSVFIETSEYKFCLYAISKVSGGEKDSFFAKEKIISLYHLQRYSDVIQNFKNFYQLIKEEREIFFIVGMSLIQVGKYKEAEAIMNKFSGNKLPSFEEKKKEHSKSVQEICLIESKNSPSPEELRELGFAYLFNAEYEKAEKIFQRAASFLAA